MKHEYKFTFFEKYHDDVFRTFDRFRYIKEENHIFQPPRRVEFAMTRVFVDLEPHEAEDIFRWFDSLNLKYEMIRNDSI